MNSRKRFLSCLFLFHVSSTTNAQNLRRRTQNNTAPTNSTIEGLETSLSELETELFNLEQTDDENLNDEEFESKMEKEQELIGKQYELGEEIDELEGDPHESEIEGDWDGDDLVGQVLNGETLEDELEEVTEELEELENEDDDGEDEELKDALEEVLEGIKEDLEEVIEEGEESGYDDDDDGYEVYAPKDETSESSLNVTSAQNVVLGGKDSLPPNVNIDPTLTMDLTQYNEPETFTKESSSEPSNMENGPDRHGINGTLPVKPTGAEVISVEDDDDDYVPPSKTESVADKDFAAENEMDAAEEGVGGDDFIPPGKTVSVTSEMEEDEDDDYAPPSETKTAPSGSAASVAESEGSNDDFLDDEFDDDDDFGLPSKSEAAAEDMVVNKTVYEISGSSTIVSETEESETIEDVMEETADDDIPPSSSVSKKPTSDDDAVQRIPVNETIVASAVTAANSSKVPMNAEDLSSEPGKESNATDTGTVYDDDDIAPTAESEDTTTQESIPPGVFNTTNVSDTLEKSSTTTSASNPQSSGDPESELKPTENDEQLAGNPQKEQNTTVTIPSENNVVEGTSAETEVPGLNTSATEPAYEPKESTAGPTSTSVIENEEAITKSTTVAETTSTQTTTKGAIATPVATPAPIEITTTQITPLPSPEPSYAAKVTHAPTLKPTNDYVEPTDDELDPVMSEQNIIDNGAFSNGEVSTPASGGGRDIDDFLREEEEEVKKVGGWMGFAAIVLAVYTAYQMSENPDGVCASICRLVITVMGCIVKLILIPFKYIFGGGRSSGGHYMATPSYREPYGSRHLELT